MSESLEVWLVDDDEAIRWVLHKALESEGWQVVDFASGDTALQALEVGSPEVLITDVRMPGMDGMALLDRVRQLHPDMPVIIITAHSDLDSAVAAYQGGAFEYLPKPFDVDEALALVRRAAGHNMRESGRESGIPGKPAQLLGEAPAMQTVFRAIGRLSSSRINVLITGESGTGKELVARALHAHSPRADQPFIAVNTAAIPRDLMESEFFGHERGAFTGAHASRRGRFEQAYGGTLFLDEIGDMPPELQTRLLRVLADGTFYRVGGHVPVNVDVRVITATHQNLEQAVEAGTFREDLFHRLNVIRVRIPPLRERRQDIPLLLSHFLQQAAAELDVPPKRLRPEVVDYLERLDWPGNVRQLENNCSWLTVMAPGQEIHMDDLPPDLYACGQKPLRVEGAPTAARDWRQPLRDWAERRLAAGEQALLEDAVPAMERVLIRAALRHTHGHRQEAARLLGWGRNTLTRKIRELDMGGELAE